MDLRDELIRLACDYRAGAQPFSRFGWRTGGCRNHASVLEVDPVGCRKSPSSSTRWSSFKASAKIK
jgi:hypothetical protein